MLWSKLALVNCSTRISPGLLVGGILDYQRVPKGWKLSYPQFLHPGKATAELGLATLKQQLGLMSSVVPSWKC